jgi:hypothetical protein
MVITLVTLALGTYSYPEFQICPFTITSKLQSLLSNNHSTQCLLVEPSNAPPAAVLSICALPRSGHEITDPTSLVSDLDSTNFIMMN